MSIAKVKEYLRDYGRDCDVQEFPVSSATVELAAKALSVEPARIAKTLSFHGDETNGCILIVTAGDMKIDNARFKKQFGFKAPDAGRRGSRHADRPRGGRCLPVRQSGTRDDLPGCLHAAVPLRISGGRKRQLRD